MFDDKNRITEYARQVQEKIDAGGVDGALATQEQRDALDKTMDITFEEHFAFQNAQARAHAMGKLTTEEAQVVYNALGEVMSDKNGGWRPGVNLAMKVTITNLMGQLVGRV